MIEKRRVWSSTLNFHLRLPSTLRFSRQSSLLRCKTVCHIEGWGAGWKFNVGLMEVQIWDCVLVSWSGI